MPLKESVGFFYCLIRRNLSERQFKGTVFLFVNILDFNGLKRLGFTMDFGDGDEK
jgi:hypothetical protein